MVYDFYQGGTLSFDDDINVLHVNSQYSKELFEIKYSYDFSNPDLYDLKQFVNGAISPKTDDFSLLMQLTFFIGQRISIRKEPMIKGFDSLSIIKESNSNFELNCYMAATILTEVFLSYGVKARMIRCLPMDLRNEECHCVTVAYVSSLKKYVVFDASMGGIYFNKCGIPMSLNEIRTAVINKEIIKCRNPFNLSADILIPYFAKNLVRFQTWEKSKYGNEMINTDATMITLNPVSVPITDKIIRVNNHVIKWRTVYNDDEFWQFE